MKMASRDREVISPVNSLLSRCWESVRTPFGPNPVRYGTSDRIGGIADAKNNGLGLQLEEQRLPPGEIRLNSQGRDGGRGRTRTDTKLPSADFESAVAANFTTRP
jgi:hypothetical protein